MLTNFLIILALILLNGLFAMAEMAVVSAKRTRLRSMADTGNKGAKAALELIDDPSRFLSTVQIGITLIGIFAGAYSGATLAAPISEILSTIPLLDDYSEAIAVTLVVITITYLSLVIGELVPKQLALKYSETIASLLSRPMQMLARITIPIVYLLDVSNKFLLRLMRVKEDTDNTVSEDDVKAMLAEGTESGVFEQQERKMIEGVMRLADQTVRAIMTPRNSIVWVDIAEPQDSVIDKIIKNRHSRMLLCDGSHDNVLGFVSVKDILVQLGKQKVLDLKSCLQKPVILPDSTSILMALDRFRESTANLALVVDEYGSVEGIVTLKDILKAIIGNLPEQNPRKNASAFQREDGSWLVDGMLPIHEVEDILSVQNMAEEDDEFHTLGGFVMYKIGHVPEEGNRLEWNDYRFEIVDMDGRRVDKVLVMQIERTPIAVE